MKPDGLVVTVGKHKLPPQLASSRSQLPGCHGRNLVPWPPALTLQSTLLAAASSSGDVLIKARLYLLLEPKKALCPVPVGVTPSACTHLSSVSHVQPSGPAVTTHQPPGLRRPATHEAAPGCLTRPLKGLRPVLGGTHTPHHLLLCPLHGLSHSYRACALITRNSEARSHRRAPSLSSQAEGTQAEDERRWGRKARPRTQPGKEGKKERERGSRRPRPGKHHSLAWVRSPARALHAQGGSEDSAGAGRGQWPPPTRR